MWTLSGPAEAFEKMLWHVANFRVLFDIIQNEAANNEVWASMPSRTFSNAIASRTKTSCSGKQPLPRVTRHWRNLLPVVVMPTILACQICIHNHGSDSFLVLRATAQ